MTLEEKLQVVRAYDEYPEKKKAKIQTIIQTLLNKTFIVRCKDDVSDNLYRCACYEKNYLKFVIEDMMGFKLYFQQDYGVIRLSCVDDIQEDEKERRSQTITKARLGYKTQNLLILLMVMYDDRSSENIRNDSLVITISDIKAELEKRNMDKDYQKSGFIGEIKESLKFFRHHTLIDFKCNELDVRDENTEIRLLPSLLFCLNEDEFSRFVEMNMHVQEEDTEEEDLLDLIDDANALEEEN